MRSYREWWNDQFYDLSVDEKVELYNRQACSEDELMTLDDDFWNNCFSSAADAVSAALEGSVNMSDDYIRQGTYSLTSFSESEAESECEDYMDEIFDDDNYSDYIDPDDYEYVAEAIAWLKQVTNAPTVIIEKFVDDKWDKYEEISTNVDAFKQYYDKINLESNTHGNITPNEPVAKGDGDPMASL